MYSKGTPSRGRKLSVMVIALVMAVLVVADPEERVQSPQGLAEKLYNQLITDLSSSHYIRKDEVQQNQPARKRVPWMHLNNADKTYQKKNSIRKKEKKKGLNPRKNKMKVRNKNSPRKRIPPFIRRVASSVVKPNKNKKMKISTNSKQAKCGKSYEVASGQNYMVHIDKTNNCNIIFRASKKTGLNLFCTKLAVGNCTEGALRLSDGVRLNARYCGEGLNVKVKAKKLAELLVAYEPQSSTSSKIMTPDVTCSIKGRKGSGYKAIGKQECPLSCGITSANAEALIGTVTTQITTLEITTPPPTTFETTTTDLQTTYMTTEVPDVNTEMASTSLATTQAPVTNSANGSTVNSNKIISSKPFSGSIKKNVAESVRIEGGKSASVGEWPWMVYVKVILGGSLLPCGGTIISPMHVLTAAHCVFDVIQAHGDKVVVVANEHNLRNKTETQSQSKAVSDIYLHPLYNSLTQTADIAILRLKGPLQMSKKVTPICIAPDMDYEGLNVVILGWGSLSYSGPDPTILREASQVVTNLNECAKNYSSLPSSHTEYPVTKDHLCAAAPGIDTCLGDSGGPVLVQLGTSWYQVGIVSFGYRCAVPDFPGVNTRVPSYASWIFKNIKRDTCK